MTRASGGPRRPSAATLALWLALLSGSGRAEGVASARAETAFAPTPAVHYEIEATLGRDGRTIQGGIVIRYRNDGPAPLSEIRLLLFPERFRHDGPELDDITRRAVYPNLEPDPGGMTVGLIRASLDGAGRGVPAEPASERQLPAGALVAVRLPDSLAPGERATLETTFETRLPERYGPFGATQTGVTAVAAWHPSIPVRDARGAWRADLGPAVASFRAELEIDPGWTVAAGGEVFPPGHARRIRLSVPAARNLELIALRDAERVAFSVGPTRVTLLAPRPPKSFRAGGERPLDRVRETLAAALERSPVPPPPRLVVVEAPLRWSLTAPSDGAVVISDRSLHVQFLLRGFHESQLAQAVFARLLRDRSRACERPEDRFWVAQAIGWHLADRFVREVASQHRSVHEWTSWLDFLAIVDRFERAPKVPFVGAFFPNSRSADPLRQSAFTWARTAAPPRMALERLSRRFGAGAVSRAIDRWLRAEPPRCAGLAPELAREAGVPLEQAERAVAAALEPPPEGPPHSSVDPTLRPRIPRSRYQVLLDSADVEVSSSEFGLAALLVARRRGDDRRDLALQPYLSDRSAGLRFGPRLHFGPRNDAATHRHDLFGFFVASWLRRSFRDDRFPDRRDSGRVAGLGLRYGFSNVYWPDDPSEQRRVRVFVDWYDRALGSDFDFVRFGLAASATTPLLGWSTIGAAQVLAGFSEPTSARGVPVQERFSLGGRRSIRGIAVERRLGRNIGLVRLEIRRRFPTDWDLDLFDVLTFRGPHLRLFTDLGQVDDSAGRALDPEHWAAGAGVALGAVYDFFGFFPGLAYVEVATRLDRDPSDVQVLLGTRQPF